MNGRLALIMVLLVVGLAGCKKDKNSSSYAEMIAGKWIESYHDRLPALTDKAAVSEFDTNGKAKLSFVVALGEAKSMISVDGNYRIDGKTLSVGCSYKYNDTTYNEVVRYEIVSIDSEVATLKYVDMTGGIRLPITAQEVGWKKVTTTKQYDIEGWWLIEKMDTTTVNFVVNYKNDGTYDFYKKDDTEMYVLQGDQKCYYQTAGDLLSTWWTDGGKDFADNWIIDYYAANYRMNWTARRVGTDGFDYQSTTSLKSIKGLNEKGEILE